MLTGAADCEQIVLGGVIKCSIGGSAGCLRLLLCNRPLCLFARGPIALPADLRPKVDCGIVREPERHRRGSVCCAYGSLQGSRRFYREHVRSMQFRDVRKMLNANSNALKITQACRTPALSWSLVLTTMPYPRYTQTEHTALTPPMQQNRKHLHLVIIYQAH